MSNDVTFVDFQEATSIKVGKFLLAKGFDVATISGRAVDSLVDSNLLGILYKDPDAKPVKYLFGLIKWEPHKMFLGTVWFDSGPKGASEESWVFEAYGREQLELTRKLADDMASIFGVKITLRLVVEGPRFETRYSDYD